MVIVKKIDYFKKFGCTFTPVFLLILEWIIFGPTEIYIANYTDFKVIYGEFGWLFIGCGIGSAVLLSFLISLLPRTLHRFCNIVIWSVAVMGYIQVMFLNNNLDLLGVHQTAGELNLHSAFMNMVIWIIGFLVVQFICFTFSKYLNQIMVVSSAILIAMQVVAMVTILTTAPAEVYEYAEGDYYLSGEEQMTLSAKKNTVVFILDHFSNQYIEPMLKKYPDTLNFLQDFTYYNNADCTLFGTYPSLTHFFTGNEFDPSLSTNEWTKESWESEQAIDFYTKLEENNYVANLYTPDTNLLCGTNDTRLLKGKFSNLTTASQDITIDYSLLYKTMLKLSAYRILPNFFKEYAYVELDEYMDIAKPTNSAIAHYNSDFNEKFLAEGITLNESQNYYTIQHLMGPHVLSTAADGTYKEEASLEETSSGCMAIVERYIDKMKELDIYNDATIVITADHGGWPDSQVIFYIKEANEQKEEMITTSAPISLADYMGTIAINTLENADGYGTSIYDYEDGDTCERTVWMRWMDKNYPVVQSYLGEKDGSSNCYYGFTYEGDYADLLEQYKIGPSEIVPSVDSYF